MANPNPNQAEALAHFTSGTDLFGQRKFVEAAREFQKVLSLTPDDGKAFYNLALSLYMLGRYREAIKNFSLAVAHGFDGHLVYYYWGVSLTTQGKHEEAIEKYDKALLIEPNHAWAYRKLGDASLELGRLGQTVEAYQSALELDATAVDFSKLVRALDGLKTSVGKIAKERISRTIGRQDKPDDFYNRWGRALYELKRYEEAIDQYRNAAHSDSRNIEVLNNWGVALNAQGRERDAIEKYKRILQIENSALGYYNWGNALLGVRKYSDATDKYLAAINIDPQSIDYSNFVKAVDALGKDEQDVLPKKVDQIADDNNRAEFHNNWAAALHKLERFTEAIEGYRKAAQIKGDSKFYFNWALALQRLERRDEALEKYAKAVEIDPKTVDAYNQRGHLFFERQNLVEAIANYEKAIENDPSNAASYNYCATALAQQEKYTAAADMLITAVSIDPYAADYNRWVTILDSLTPAEREKVDKDFADRVDGDSQQPVAYLTWGMALHNLRRYDEAIEKYQKALAIIPEYVEALNNWGLALSAQKKPNEGIQKFQEALRIKPKYLDAHFNWGAALADQKSYVTAIEKFRDAIKADPAHPYAYHNVAAYLWVQGQYKPARERFKAACSVYESFTAKAKELGNPEYFQYYGRVMHDTFGDLEKAEQTYNEGLKLNANHIGLLINLVDLYMEKKDVQTADKTLIYWQAWDRFRQIEALLTDQIQETQDNRLLLQLGNLYLTMEEYEQAEKTLLDVRDGDKDSAAAYANLGVLYTKREEFKRAIQYYEEALRRDPEDLSVRSNMAEAYLKSNLVDKAYAGYKYILDVTSGHVESQIGMGGVYIAMGEAGDGDKYHQAITHFTEAIKLAQTNEGSKRLKQKDLAAVFYSRGYARVSLYEAAKTIRDEGLLQKALEDFKNCSSQDSEHYKAQSAIEKIEQRKGAHSSFQRLPEKYGPLGIVALSLLVFLLTLLSFFFNWPSKNIDAKYLVMITFGALIFMVAGLYLPQLLKLKVAGIELEKSAVDQITIAGSLGISK